MRIKHLFLIALITATITGLHGQEQINNSIPFQSVESKDYSIVIPSSYQEGQSIAAFLALHPWNTSRWNGQTWCEELADFAEANDVILVCPDGGPDGQIDDPIDTAFASFILDSAFQWYDIDPERLYAIGFSWGGRTTYTYGLNHIDKFAGLLPIGAAVSTNEIANIEQNIDGVPVYIVHGSADSPNIRFYPMRDAMLDNGACVETNLLQGVGHTIDFDNQVEILTEAYQYLQNNACTTTSTQETKIKTDPILPHNAITTGSQLLLNISDKEEWSIFAQNGRQVKVGKGQNLVIDLTIGTYIITVGERSELFKVF